MQNAKRKMKAGFFMADIFYGTRIFTDATDFRGLLIRVDPHYPRHPRAIIKRD